MSVEYQDTQVVIRGGSWDATSFVLRSPFHFSYTSSNKNIFVSFRIVLRRIL